MTCELLRYVIIDIEIEIQSIIWNVNIQRIRKCRFEESENSRIEERLVDVFSPKYFDNFSFLVINCYLKSQDDSSKEEFESDRLTSPFTP